MHDPIAPAGQPRTPHFGDVNTLVRMSHIRTADAGPPVAGGGINAVACSLGVVTLSCALFGVTYRYAVRGEDANNPQLMAGVVAAFGLVRFRLGTRARFRLSSVREHGGGSVL